MFCMYCGKEIPDNAGFCPYCGKKIPTENDVRKTGGGMGIHNSVNGSAGLNLNVENIAKTVGNAFDKVDSKVRGKMNIQDPLPITHPYQKLGGFMAFLAYGQLLFGLYLVLCILFFLFGGFRGMIPLWLMLMLLGTLGVAAYLHVKYFLMVQKKDAGFLRYIEMWTFIGWGVIVFLFLVFYIYIKNAFGEYSSVIIAPVLGEVIVYSLIEVGIDVLEFLYYGKSVRVRTYFGSDEYLRRSIIFHNKVYPVPAVPDRT